MLPNTEINVDFFFCRYYNQWNNIIRIMEETPQYYILWNPAVKYDSSLGKSLIYIYFIYQ